MKRRLWFLLILLVLFVAFAGIFILRNDISWDAADMAVRAKLGIWDLSDFEVSIGGENHTVVTYHFRPCGFGTYESIRVYINAQGKVFRIESDLEDVYQAMSSVTHQQLKEAEEALWQQVKNYPEADRERFRLMVRDNGCLYLYTELIVDALPGEEPPCEDHWHKFFQVDIQ